MVRVTDRALDQLETIREQHNLEGDEGVTLVAQGGGELGLAVTKPNPNDEIVERDGKTVMIVPEILVEPLKSVVIDYVDTPEMEGFTLEQEAQ